MFPRLLTLFALLLAVFGLAACDASGYRKQWSQWSYGDTKFMPLDAATFVVLDEYFAHDALRGYYLGTEIADSDGATFAGISEHEARDQNHVYYCDTYRKAAEYWSIQRLRIVRIAGADPQTYRSLGEGYARDRQRVYADGVAIVVRDPATFEPLSGDFARDSQRGYFAHVEIRGSHGQSFELLDEQDMAYARDRTNGYHAHDGAVHLLAGADPASLRVLGRDYAVDARHVWHRGQPVAGADPATFAIDESYVGPTDATDRSGAWNDGRRVPVAVTLVVAK